MRREALHIGSYALNEPQDILEVECMRLCMIGDKKDEGHMRTMHNKLCLSVNVDTPAKSKQEYDRWWIKRIYRLGGPCVFAGSMIMINLKKEQEHVTR